MIKRGKFRKILIWFFVFICAIMAIGTIPSVEMILFAGVAVMLLPIKKIAHVPRAGRYAIFF